MGWARIERDVVDGRPVIRKVTVYDARLEADGLRALAAAGAPVPDVLAVDRRSLTMTEVSGRPEWASLGVSLAAVHRATADRFGYPIENVIGSLPQPNPWTEEWGEFYAVNRVLIHLDDPAVPPELAQRLRR